MLRHIKTRSELQKEEEERQRKKTQERRQHRKHNNNRYASQMISSIEDLRNLLDSAQNSIKNNNYNRLKNSIYQAEEVLHELQMIIQRAK